MGVLPKGDYSDSVMYDVNDWVNGADGQYASKRSGNIGHPLSDKEWWTKVVDLAKLNNAVKAATDATDAAVEINTEIRNAERDRVSAEQTREAYEVERREHETERVTAEGNRASAESTRTANENARSQAEQERQGAETNRVSAEQERVSHEQERVSAEQTRVSKEQERVAAETQRVLDEDNRKDAEAERQRVFTQHEAERSDAFTQNEAGRTNTFNQHEVERDRKIDEAIAKFPVDAPKDGKKYGRKDGEWSEIKEGSDTPIDTELNPETADNEHAAGAKVTADKLTALDLKTTYLLHLFGEYATPAPQSLAIDPTRKDVAISAESMSEVAAQGWAISQPITIKKGNIYRIKVGEASGQYVTTAMRYQYRDEQGNLRYAYKRKTQLDEHSELPVDGYLIMYGLPRDYELVVCFKYTAQYDPQVEVLTAGLLRTLAFQLGDMQDMIDQKLDVNGHSSAASVGGAMALLQKGDVPEDTYSELLTARMIGNAPDLMHVHGSTDTRTGIDDGKDVNVVVEKVWGDVIGGNQMCSYKTPYTNATTDSRYFVNLFILSDNAVNLSLIPIQQPTIASSIVTVPIGASGIRAKHNGSIADLWIIDTKSPVAAGHKALVLLPFEGTNPSKVGGVRVSARLVIDLTLLFPTDTSFVDSLTETDAIKVAHRLGFAAFTLD